MGVDRSDYILLGYEVKEYLEELDDDEVDELYEKYSRYKKNAGDIILLSDNYSGEYVYFGIVIQGDEEGYHGLSPYVFDDDLPIERDKIEKTALEEFQVDDSAKLIVLTHWH